MLAKFSSFCRLLTVLKITFFKKFFQENYQSVKRLGSRSGPTVCPDLCPNCHGSKDYEQTTKVVTNKELISTLSRETISEFSDILVIQGRIQDFLKGGLYKVV